MELRDNMACRECERRELIARCASHHNKTRRASISGTKIRLKKIDLTKGDGHQHPDIKTGKTQYLMKHDNSYYAGTFETQWYGLFFNGWNDVGLQYDKPGTNSSNWQDVWEIVEVKRKRSKAKNASNPSKKL